MTTSSSESDVLVVGAGPTGLVLALWLTRLAVQARTLELYRQVGLADALVDAGRKAVAVNLWVAGRQVGHVAFGDMGQGLSPYPYALIYPQDEHEQLLIRPADRARRQGRASHRARGI